MAKGRQGLAKLNPEAQRPVEFIVSIDNAPGPFGIVSSGAQYDVANEDECGQIHPVAGTPTRMTSTELIHLTKVSDHEYRGTAYTDLLLNEDYFGRGVCRWEFSGASAMLKATVAQDDTRFMFFMDSSRLLGGELMTRFYSASVYPRADMPSFPAFGNEDRDAYRPELKSRLFSVSMNTRVEPK